VESDALVRDYLARLEAAAAGLPAERRTELIAEVREHIDAAVSGQANPTETTVRNVLDRLGSPDEIVAAEAPASWGPVGTAVVGTDGTATAARPGIGPLEVVALLLVTVGMFVAPIVGPAVGIALVWLSRAWSTRAKLVITGIAVVVVLLPIVGLMSVGGGSEVIESSAEPAP
jgi:uncharacterized membrane protein